MEVLIRDQAEAGCTLGAKIIARVVRDKPDAVLGLATGRTPERLYQELIRLHRDEGLDFSRVTSFNLDEYVGLPGDHPQSYRHFMREKLFRHINIDPAHTHVPDGTAADLQVECRVYEEKIGAAGGIDLQLLGLGRNGHIGFNEPTGSLRSRTWLKILSEQTLRDNSTVFGSFAEMPRHALTMDIGTILDKNRVQPTVEITAAEPTGDGTARVTVRAAGTERAYGGEARTSGVRDVRLFRDGQLVGWADGTVVSDTGDWEHTFQAPLASGADSVAFSAYAFNRDLVKSRTARATLAVPASVAPRRPRRAFVVSLGVDAFDDPAWDLAFAAADARAYASALDSTLSASGDYHEVVAVTLVSAHDGTHGEGASTDATASALRGALLRLAGDPLDADAEAALARVPGADRLAEATPDDVVVVTASTHGYASPEGVFYLLPADVPTLPRGRALESPAFLEAAVSSDELSAWLRGVDAGALAVVVDACNAAGAVEGSGFKPGPMGARGLGQLAFDKGAAVLTATQADAPALEASSTGRGLLTFALVENGLLAGQADGAGVGPGDPDGPGAPDGRITLAEWLAYGAQRVPELYEEVRAGEVETYGRGGEVRARSLPPDLAVGAEAAAAGAQTPALFDFRKGARDVVLADD